MSAEPEALPCLVIFCRRPAPGCGKRRLAAEIGDQAAAEIAGLLLDAAIEDARDWPGPVAIAPASTADADWAATQLARDGWRVIAQPTGNLGQRINQVDRQLRQVGITGTVFVGSDAPALQPHDYQAALAALQDHETVLAPAADGGVTLMGSVPPWPDLSSLPWGTCRLGHALEQCCERARLRIARLTERRDVDRAADLHRLLTDLDNDVRPARVRLKHWVEQWAHAGPCSARPGTGR